jgi:sulfite exporter TauE/SafE
VTVIAFAIGATAGGTAIGALAGGLGRITLASGPSVRVRLAVLALALVVAVALDLRARTVPGPHRQVNERWLDEFRGWVYGVGFGAQLGLGVTTMVSSAATYVALIAAFETGSPSMGALIVGSYGAVRGLTPLLAAGVRTPPQLIALHRRFAAWEAPARRLTAGGLVASAFVAVLAILP